MLVRKSQAKSGFLGFYAVLSWRARERRDTIRIPEKRSSTVFPFLVSPVAQSGSGLEPASVGRSAGSRAEHYYPFRTGRARKKPHPTIPLKRTGATRLPPPPPRLLLPTSSGAKGKDHGRVDARIPRKAARQSSPLPPGSPPQPERACLGLSDSHLAFVVLLSCLWVVCKRRGTCMRGCSICGRRSFVFSFQEQMLP